MTFLRSRAAAFALIVLMAGAVVSALPGFAHAQEQPENVEDIYRLGPDDVLSVIVYGEKDLSGEYKISAAGTLSVPLIGEVKAAGLTTRETEELLTAKFSDGFLVGPSVAIQIREARPVYIMGEVKNPGGYKYASNMTALNAVALAGGFTYRARQKKVDVMRGNESVELLIDSKIAPGDIITVNERLF